MSSSCQVFTVANKSFDTPRFRTMRHQVRMEVVAKTGKKMLDVGMILSKLMIRANKKFVQKMLEPVDIGKKVICK
jgi:hypothetical protein